MNLTVFFLPTINYEAGLRWQKRLFNKSLSKKENFLILTEHFPVITLGRGGGLDQLLVPLERLKLYQLKLVNTDRGGGITLHLPGQLVVYPILNLGIHYDWHFYLRQLEEVMLRALVKLDIKAARTTGKTGVWINHKKVGAIGIKVSHGVCYHGFSLNVNNDLTLYRLIKQCGLTDPVTSVQEVKKEQISLNWLKKLVINSFLDVFNVQDVSIKTTKSKKACLA